MVREGHGTTTDAAGVVARRRRRRYRGTWASDEEGAAVQCPKCGGSMEAVTFASIEVDRCVGCRGIWFDMLEADRLKPLRGSEVIDDGDPRIGRRYNEQGKINCPKCGNRMIPLVDARQPHLWYESCNSCFGVFFDAGEFRDFKNETVADFFRDLFAGPRPT
jgi:Zn-finger nucleic acid-binding protein